MKDKTCFFIGDRFIDEKNIDHVLKRLNEEIDALIEKGVTNFISCAQVGFDMIAASMVLAKREMGQAIRLILMVDRFDRETIWSEERKRLHDKLFCEADEVHFVDHHDTNDMIKKRLEVVTKRANYCIYRLNNSLSHKRLSYIYGHGIYAINLA